MIRLITSAEIVNIQFNSKSFLVVFLNGILKY